MQRRDVMPGQFPGGQDLIGQDTGFVIGARGWELLRLDTDAHFVTMAKTGGGKGRSVAIPNLLTHPGSVLSVEIGGATLKDTINYRRHVLKQKVYVFDPFGVTDEPCAHLNLLDTLDPARKTFDVEVSQIAESLMQNSDGKKEENVFFQNVPEELLAALITHVVTAKDIPSNQRNFLTVARLLGQYGSEDWTHLMLRFKKDRGEHSEILHNIGNYFTDVGRGEHYDSIVKSASQWLRFATTKGLSDTQLQSDFRLSDLKDGNTTIYIVMPDVETYKSKRVNPWLRLLIERAIHACPNKGDAGRGTRYEDRVLFMLDEFTHLGKLQAIETGVQTTRQKRITIWSIFQDLGQLQKVYGKEAANSFMGAAACIQAFAVNDEITAEFISKRAGKDIALIPTVSQAFSVNNTVTITENHTNGFGYTVTNQHGVSESMTETHGLTVTDGWSQSVADAFSNGGYKGVSHSHTTGGSSGSSSGGSYGRGGYQSNWGSSSSRQWSDTYGTNEGTNWNYTRTINYGTNGSRAQQTSSAQQTGTQRSQSNGVNVQYSVQNGTSNAESRGYTVTLQYTPQIIPKLDVADVYALLNGDDKQILFVTTNGYHRNIVDGRAYYDKIPMLYYRAYGPAAPAMAPLPAPLEAPPEIPNKLNVRRPVLALPHLPSQTLSFPRLDFPLASEMETVKVRIPKFGEEITLRDASNKHKDVKEKLDNKSGGWLSRFIPTADVRELRKQEKWLREVIADAKIEAVRAMAKQSEAWRRDAYTVFAQIETRADEVKQYAQKIAQARSTVENDAVLLRKAEEAVRGHAETLEQYRTTVIDDTRADSAFFSALPDMKEYAQYYYDLRQKWVSLPEPARPVVMGITQQTLRQADEDFDKNALFSPGRIQKVEYSNLVGLPENPSLSKYKHDVPYIPGMLTTASTYIDPEKMWQSYSLEEIEKCTEKLIEELWPSKVNFPYIKRKVLSWFKRAKTDDELRTEICMHQDAKQRLASEIYREAFSKIVSYSSEIAKTNNFISLDEDIWKSQLELLRCTGRCIENAYESNDSGYRVLWKNLAALDEQRRKLDQANKVITGQRARKAMQVALWEHWDRYTAQTKRIQSQQSQKQYDASQRPGPHGTTHGSKLGGPGGM